MKQRFRFWGIFILIIAISWFDFQYFNEGYYSKFVPPNQRQNGHIIALILIAFIGYFAWRNFPLQWIKKLWAYPYGIFILVQIAVGIIQKSTKFFGKEFLDQIHTTRLIFSSPFPFLVLYFVYRLVKNNKI